MKDQNVRINNIIADASDHYGLPILHEGGKFIIDLTPGQLFDRLLEDEQVRPRAAPKPISKEPKPQKAKQEKTPAKKQAKKAQQEKAKPEVYPPAVRQRLVSDYLREHRVIRSNDVAYIFYGDSDPLESARRTLKVLAGGGDVRKTGVSRGTRYHWIGKDEDSET